jgi:hypothetical protein
MLGIDDPTLLALVNQLGRGTAKKEQFVANIPETNPIVTSIAIR